MSKSAVFYEFISPEAERIYNGKLEKAHDNDSCFDLYAVEDVEVYHDSVALIPLGVRFNIPEGYEGRLYARSSSPVKKHILIPNGVGVIDEGYRGEVKMTAVRINPYGCTKIKKGDKVAQIQFRKRDDVIVAKGKVSLNSNRGDGGFGSTGN